ncbi:Na-translocating system protein MpsC family protein [Saccharibacillus alkalitolerans]|nr:Na-translocating system protein MpsC family protein [Saccharibacillus alkalitolerans]
MMNEKETISLVTSYVGKLLRNRFGKGPEAVNVFLCERCIVFHLRNFMGPVEKFLLTQEEEKAFRYTRELLMESLLPELKVFLQENADLNVSEFYYDWGVHNASGAIVGMFGSALDSQEDYPGKEDVHEKVVNVTAAIQKIPEHIDSWWVTPKMLAVFRQGITVLLEKEMVELGYTEVLKATKRRLEKRMLEQDANAGAILNKKLTDLYADWDFDRDRSVVIYIFQE